MVEMFKHVQYFKFSIFVFLSFLHFFSTKTDTRKLFLTLQTSEKHSGQSNSNLWRLAVQHSVHIIRTNQVLQRIFDFFTGTNVSRSGCLVIDLFLVRFARLLTLLTLKRFLHVSLFTSCRGEVVVVSVSRIVFSFAT